MSLVGPPMSPGIKPGPHEDWYSLGAEGFRRKRSIRQYYSNMYDSLLAFKVHCCLNFVKIKSIPLKP